MLEIFLIVYELIYLFEQVVVDMTTHRVTFEIKVNVHVFSKSTRVVIAIGLCISKSL